MTSSYLPLCFDVTDQVPSLPDPHLEIAAWLFVPPMIEQRAPAGLLFCLPGGSYTKAYYHLEVEGHAVETYSFALFMAQRGFLVIAVDHLGVGESTHPKDELELNLEVMAQANAAVVTQIRDRLAKGSLVKALSPLAPCPVIAVGHSMGAQLAIIQQSHFHSFDALALLGWSNQAISLGATEEQIAQETQVEVGPDDSATDLLEQVIQFKQDAQNMAALRAPFHPFFFAPDVPQEVIQADDALAVPLPIGIALAPHDATFISQEAAAIAVPIFLGNGIIDVTTSFRNEVASYTQSHDITLFELQGSAHCHNFATTREVLWRHIADWALRVNDHYLL